MLIAGARRRRLDHADEAKKGRVFRALAVIAGLATIAIWVALDWPFADFTFVNQWTPYVAASFVVTLAFTFAYNIANGAKEVKAEQ
jgi:hypothetical protein